MVVVGGFFISAINTTSGGRGPRIKLDVLPKNVAADRISSATLVAFASVVSWMYLHILGEGDGRCFPLQPCPRRTGCDSFLAVYAPIVPVSFVAADRRDSCGARVVLFGAEPARVIGD